MSTAYKFRIYWEQDDTVYRDIQIKPGQAYLEFHKAILMAFGFDNKHQASFFKSNDKWLKGEEVSLEPREGCKSMEKTPLVALIDDPHQKLLYRYDYEMEWDFLCELMGIVDLDPAVSYPRMVRSEGVAPKQYGVQTPTTGLINDEIFDEKLTYDAEEAFEGTEEGEESDETTEDSADEDESAEGDEDAFDDQDGNSIEPMED